ncbi:hypothetical protein HIM_09492 [Hirsutella minnesotensis 3608]|uniref:ABC transporter domain-containing protein n=1 Tax=Hirsutella minnesotensis 3608 TaxID=1043627 RepID=A0A0F7ZSC8_9HYPO|nr:hypothetical protein HIM_09492 [Hirsutella minnesotensis 3608]
MSRPDHHPPADKLHLLSSPVVRRARQGSGNGSQSEGHGAGGAGLEYKYTEEEDEIPDLIRHEEPTLLELLVDVFLAANLNIFAETQKVTSVERFKGFIGYFCLLWLTWFLVTIFDVCFVTDSIFARVTRAIQLGVLVGFVVVAPNFDPMDLDSSTMRALSIILAVSRASLTFEYGSLLRHLRRFKRTRLPIYLQMGTHVVASLVYLGVVFAFDHNDNNRGYIAWYIISGIEAIVSILLSNLSPILSLTRTHLMKRVSLLTVLIMGDGIIDLAKEVLIIVKNANAWDAMTVGLLAAAAATTYSIFLIYFDWMKGRYYLPAIRQQLWASLHLPFHLALALHIQSFTQWLLWSKFWTAFNQPIIFYSNESLTSFAARDSVRAKVDQFLHDYPSQQPTSWDSVINTQNTINDALNNITTIPNSFWENPGERAPGFDIFNQSFSVIGAVLSNTIFLAFGIPNDIVTRPNQPNSAGAMKGAAFQFRAEAETWNLCKLVFAYGYIAAGSTMILMAILAMISRPTPLEAWHKVRYGLVFLLAVGVGVTASLLVDDNRSEAFLKSPWVLCTITFVWHIKGISGGERRCVLIAIQILSDSRVLLLGEPTSGLDAFTAKSIMDVLCGLAAEGRTLIISVHQAGLDIYSKFGNMLLLTQDGRTAYSGAAKDMMGYFAKQGYPFARKRPGEQGEGGQFVPAMERHRIPDRRQPREPASFGAFHSHPGTGATRSFRSEAAISATGLALSIANAMGGVLSIDIPAFFRAVNYLSPIRYALRIVAAFSLRGVHFTCAEGKPGTDGRCHIGTGEEVLRLYKLREDPVVNIAALAACVVVYRVLDFVLLKLARMARKAGDPRE